MWQSGGLLGTDIPGGNTSGGLASGGKSTVAAMVPRGTSPIPHGNIVTDRVVLNQLKEPIAMLEYYGNRGAQTFIEITLPNIYRKGHFPKYSMHDLRVEYLSISFEIHK